MKTLKIGGLYRTLRYNLLVFPTKEKASTAAVAAATAAATGTATRAAYWSDYWSKRLDCKVHYSEPNEVFMCLKQKSEFVHILFGDKQGWIICKDWVGIEEAKE